MGKLTDYLKTVKNQKEKLRIIIEQYSLYHRDNNYFSIEELSEFYQIFDEEVCQKKKVTGDDGRTRIVVDKEKYEENMRLLVELKFEAYEKQAELVNKYAAYFDMLYGKRTKMIDTFDNNGQRVEKLIDINREIAKQYAKLSPNAAFIGSILEANSILYNPQEQIAKALEADKEFYDMTMLDIKAELLDYKTNRRDMDAVVNVTDEDIQDKYNQEVYSRYYRYVNKKMLDDCDPNRRAVLEEMAQVDHYGIYNELVAGVNAKNYGMDLSKLGGALQFAKFSNGTFARPWLKGKEFHADAIKNITNANISEDLSFDEMKVAATNLVALCKEMKTKMKSTLYDTQSYKDMIAALDSDWIKRAAAGNVTEENKDDLKNALKDVMSKCGAYVSSHATNRTSENGKKRFKAAMAALGVIDMNIAELVNREVDAVRAKEKTPQHIDIKAVQKEYGVKTAHDIDVLKFINDRDEMASGKSIDQIISDKFKFNAGIVGKEDFNANGVNTILQGIGKEAGLNHQEKPERYKYNVIMYYRYTHPDEPKMTINGLYATGKLDQAYADYKNFINANKVYKITEGSTKNGYYDLNTTKEHSKNLAAFHQFAYKNMCDISPLPDFTNKTVREENLLAAENMFQEYINISQNEEPLLEVQDDVVIPYTSLYDGGVDAHIEADKKSRPLGTLGRVVQTIYDENATFQQKIGALFALEYTKDMYVGKTPEQIYKEGNSIKLDQTLNAIRTVFIVDFMTQNNDLMPQFQEYLKSGGVMPEELRKRFDSQKNYIDVLANGFATTMTNTIDKKKPRLTEAEKKWVDKQTNKEANKSIENVGDNVIDNAADNGANKVADNAADNQAINQSNKEADKKVDKVASNIAELLEEEGMSNSTKLSKSQTSNNKEINIDVNKDNKKDNKKDNGLGGIGGKK